MTDLHRSLQLSLKKKELRLLDWHTGAFLEKIAGHGPHPELFLAGTLASAAIGNGHVCLPLDQARNMLPPAVRLGVPEHERWRGLLLDTPVVGHPGETAPLILDARNRLYLYRFYRYETFVAKDLLARAALYEQTDVENARKLLQRLFAEKKSNDQQLAAVLALLKRFIVISGGPGTGKTHTISRILAFLQGLSPRPLRIALAAPTGKAAARMEESIRTAKRSLPDDLADSIPEQATTLHRLLGYRPEVDSFSRNAHNQLSLDLLILDEASMIDLPMMYALLQALPQTTRLILLGDRHQLASVEAGSLFSDLCRKTGNKWSTRLCGQIHRLTDRDDLQAQEQAHPMTDSVMLLTTNYRFRQESGIGCLSTAVKEGAAEAVEKTLSKKFPDLKRQGLTGKSREEWLRRHILQGVEPIFLAGTVEQAFTAMEEFRVLCAVRKGPSGVAGINSLAEKTLRQKGLITTDSQLYPGRPVLIRRNNPELQLFNGDTGLLWNDAEGRLKAWFKRADNSLYPITPARLPAHDTAYAITIHKAQGSEFSRVLLLLPEEENRVLSRELLYTGITRARKRLLLCASPEILFYAVRKKTVRHSGLADSLWAD